MGFMADLKETYDDNNFSVTENGAIGYASTGKRLLDLNFATSSLRHETEEEIADRFEDAYAENKLLALKWAFFCRDIRGGLGERRTPRAIYKSLIAHHPDVAKAIIPLIPEYGRWDDLFEYFGTKLEKDALEFIGEQLNSDQIGMIQRKSISLLAKWLPSLNASSKETRRKAKIVKDYLGCSEKSYRRMLSGLRKYVDVIERKMSARNWHEINYETVPSKANLLYKNAFMKHDEVRRTAYLESLTKGEAKINASTNFPHDIVHKYGSTYDFRSGAYRISNEDTTLEELWKALPDYVNGASNTLVVRDGSGSMGVALDFKSKVTAMDVSTALAIYFSEKSGGEFKDKFITFSSKPKLVDLSGYESLAQKLRRTYRETECSNTDIEKTFDLILRSALEHKTKQEDMPQNILIISDMEFDYATTMSYRYRDDDCKTLFDKIAKKFSTNGYKLPRLVFWNVNSRTGTIPVKENSLGVALVSGFSPTVCKMVLSGKLDPYECLLDQLNVDRYKPVEAAVKGLI